MLVGEGGIEDRGVVIGVFGVDIYIGIDSLGIEVFLGLWVGLGVFIEVVEVRVGDGVLGFFLLEIGFFVY